MWPVQPAARPALEGVPAIVLCGGRGTRLHPLTHDLIPKALVRVGDRTLLEHTLAAIHRDGVRRAVLAVAHHADQVRRFVGAGRCGVEISYYQSGRTTGLLQDLTGAYASAGFTGDVLLTGCDELYEGLDLAAVHAFHRSMQATATLLLAEGIPAVERHIDATLDADERVQWLVKSQPVEGRSGVLGLSMLSAEFVDRARAVTPAADLDDRAVLVRRLLPALIREGRVAGYRCHLRFYLHVSTPDAHARAAAWALAGEGL